MLDGSASISSFLDAAAARQPTPGGGSVAALAGALAASMGEMVLHYSIGKKGLEEHAPALTAALKEFHQARRLLMELMREDQAAFTELSAQRKAPPSPRRDAAVADALLACVRIPQAMAAAAASILDLADRIVGIVNPHLLSDLAVCADLAMATARCAIYNVRVNLNDITDPKQRWEIETGSGQVLSRALMAVQRVSPKIWQRVNEAKRT